MNNSNKPGGANTVLGWSTQQVWGQQQVPAQPTQGAQPQNNAQAYAQHAQTHDQAQWNQRAYQNASHGYPQQQQQQQQQQQFATAPTMFNQPAASGQQQPNVVVQPAYAQQGNTYGQTQQPQQPTYGQPSYGQQPTYGQPQPSYNQPQVQPFGSSPGTPSYPQPPSYGQTPSYGQGYPQSPQSYPSAAAYNQPQGYPQAPAAYSSAPASDHAGDPSGRPIDGANATVGVSDRVSFIRKTYIHLFGAMLAFTGLLWAWFNVEPMGKLIAPFVEFSLKGRWNWGVVLAAFMATSYAADYFATNTESKGLQYVGLGLYVLAESVIFVPLLVIVQFKTATIIAKGGGDPHIIRDAAYTTLALFGALTASVFFSKKDFSFLRSGLYLASGAALMLIAGSIVFGFNLGLAFSIGMVLLAAGYILFQTSQIIAHHDPRQHVSAALELFASVALMFWYVIRIFLRARE